MTTQQASSNRYTPFVRQIIEFERYSKHGNTFMSVDLDVSNYTVTQVKEAVRSLLQKRALFRSVFSKEPITNSLEVCELASSNSIFQTTLIKISCFDEIEYCKSEFLKEKKFSSNLDTPLFFSRICFGSKISKLNITVHHIICDNVTLNLIKSDIMSILQNLPLVIRYQFKDYAKYMNARLTNRLEKDLNYHKKILNFSDLEIIPSNTHGLSTKKEIIPYLNSITYKFIEDFSNSQPMSYKTKLIIVGNCQIKHSFSDSQFLNWKSIVISALSDAAYNFFGREVIVGFLVNGRYNKYNINNVGDFLGFCYYNFTALEHNETHLKNSYNKLLRAYRHPIFNPALYNINQKSLRYNACPIFLNYSYRTDFFTDLRYNGIFFAEEICLYDIDATITFFDRGTMLITWKFDNSIISKKEIIEFDKNFKILLLRLVKIR